MKKVIGAVDGFHIPVNKPTHGIKFFNRKHFYFVIQGICKSNNLFSDVDDRWPGTVHEARVFSISEIYPHGLALCVPDYIIGNAAYPCKNWAMTPYTNNGHLTATYILIIAKIRVKIEYIFALLLERFRRLTEMLDMNEMENIMSAIIAACVLHNICILQMDDNDIEHYINVCLQNIALIRFLNVNHNDNKRGFQRRDILAEQLWNR
ncbi:hypothetical protein NQ314_004927 [Rhamnusium bicolor]|uniref:DDE Tnp4 domain-containing protein n=1 Tax=Rhamnusium bicolor TaxID=1586634 RepID=A0AAV8ZIL9_9CUCU|nr:hypothetical protein NQ314_004927 [Rhamnusium bicolor]